MNAGNGYTQKETLQLLLDGQNRLHDRIDDLEDKVDKKVGRQELFGWVTAGVVSLTGLMAFFGYKTNFFLIIFKFFFWSFLQLLNLINIELFDITFFYS